MKCPKCSDAMETKFYGPRISLERCANCYGLFVAPEVLEEMRSEWMSEAFLDIGHPQIGKTYDKIDEIDCPECHVQMNKIMDPVQTHIWMEQCPSCDKVFLDAGEFSDLKYKTLSDKLKGLLRGRRKPG